MNNFRLLSTAELPTEVVQHPLIDQNIQLEVIPFIKIELLSDAAEVKAVNLLSYKKVSVVFTSANAVKAAARILLNQPEWTTYCIENTTGKAVETLLPQCRVARTAPNAASLAEAIKQQGETNVIFFCGDQSLPVLPQTLTEAGIQTQRIILYRTVATPAKIEGRFDGILFFSPSAVNSYFSRNHVETDTILFAPGATTAAAIRLHSNNPIVISEQPSRKAVVETAINHLKELNTTA